jgi:hypothetical protein
VEDDDSLELNRDSMVPAGDEYQAGCSHQLGRDPIAVDETIAVGGAKTPDFRIGIDLESLHVVRRHKWHIALSMHAREEAQPFRA